jgi:hypothetical protein
MGYADDGKTTEGQYPVPFGTARRRDFWVKLQALAPADLCRLKSLLISPTYRRS